MALGAMLLWGGGYVPSRWLVARIPALEAAGSRLVLGGAALLAVAWIRGGSVRPRTPLVVVGWLAVTQSVAFYGAVYIGIARSGAGFAAVLANTDPLFTAIFGALVLHERLRGRQWCGLVLGLAGAAVAVTRGSDVWPPRVSIVGLALIGGAVAWGLGTVTAARRVRDRADVLILGGWQMLLGGTVLWVWGIAVEGVPGPIGLRAALLIGWLGLACSALPLVLFYRALAAAPAGEVSAWFVLVPVVGVVSAWPALGEEPGGRLVGGLVAIAVGLWLVLVRPRHTGERLLPSRP